MYSLLLAGRSRQVLAVLLFVLCGVGDSSGQQRRRFELQPPAPLPEIAGETAACSGAFHEALTAINATSVRPLTNFDQLARVPEPGLSGRWIHWLPSARGSKAPPLPRERVCAENAIRNGRERCVRFELKPLDPALVALFAVPATADELSLLRALDGFVVDRGAPLEFGPNGRQFATLQRVAAELGNYSAQPKHPALCNGVPEMMEFKIAKLSGLRKRFDDVAALSKRASALAYRRVMAVGEMQVTEARMAAASVAAAAEAALKAQATAASAPSAPAETAAISSAAPPVAATAATPPPAPKLIAIQAGLHSEPAALLEALIEALLGQDVLAEFKKPATMTAKLQLARDLLGSETTSTASPAVRGAAGAALRMIEAAHYGRLQVARMGTFDGLFFGSINRILEAHRTKCTCAS